MPYDIVAETLDPVSKEVIKSTYLEVKTAVVSSKGGQELVVNFPRSRHQTGKNEALVLSNVLYVILRNYKLV